MIVPFRFTWTPAAADATTTINPVSQSDNAVLAALLAIGASALTNAQLAATQLPTDAQKFWVTEFSVTAKYGCEVQLGYLDSAADAFIPLYTTFGTFGGSGGHSQRFAGVGLYVPRKPRIKLVAGDDADGVAVFVVAGHLEVVGVH
jgi:hypothetical protein